MSTRNVVQGECDFCGKEFKNNYIKIIAERHSLSPVVNPDQLGWDDCCWECYDEIGKVMSELRNKKKETKNDINK